MSDVDRYHSHADLAAADPELAGWLALLPEYDPWALMPEGGWFDARLARWAVAWFEGNLRHVKGPAAGRPFLLEPWQKGVLACLWGFRTEAGLRRYREVLLYVGKKNGKSAFAAGILLMCLCADGELGAEVYSAAASRDQAALIFGHAAGMVRQSPALKARLRVYGERGGSQMRAIVFQEQMSSYKCLSADANTADGANVHMAVVDELHRHKTPELADVLAKSTAARSQPLILYTTTADYSRESLCNSKLAYAKRVRANAGDPTAPGYDPAFLPVVYECSAEDDWRDPATWRKANPNLGVTVPEAFLAREAKKAAETPSELNNFLRLHLNIVTDADIAWLDMAAWDACEPDRTPEQVVEHLADLERRLAGERWYGGLDLAQTTDQSAFARYYPDHGVLLLTYWMPAEAADRAERKLGTPYYAWSRAGLIRLIPGAVSDFAVIERDILAMQEGCVEIGYDPWNAEQTRQRLEAAGLKCVKWRQGPLTFHEPTCHFERLVTTGALRHGGHPILRWNASNVMLREDANRNVMPSKKKSTGQIDGVVASIMALGGAIMQPAKVSLDSIYASDDEGLTA